MDECERGHAGLKTVILWFKSILNKPYNSMQLFHVWAFTSDMKLHYEFNSYASPGFSFWDSLPPGIGKILQYDPYENLSLIITDSYKRKIVSFRRLFHPVSCLHKTSWFSLFPRDPRTERLVCTDQGNFFSSRTWQSVDPYFSLPSFRKLSLPKLD